MADGDDGNSREPEIPRTPDSSREGTPDWKETCIGVWSRSTKGHQVTEAEPDKICNGISFVVINKVSSETRSESCFQISSGVVLVMVQVIKRVDLTH